MHHKVYGVAFLWEGGLSGSVWIVHKPSQSEYELISSITYDNSCTTLYIVFTITNSICFAQS